MYSSELVNLYPCCVIVVECIECRRSPATLASQVTAMTGVSNGMDQWHGETSSYLFGSGIVRTSS